MHAMAKAKPTAPPTPELATARLNLKLTPAQAATIDELARTRGSSVKQAIVDAVAAFSVRDEASELADLGRKVVELVAARTGVRPGR